MESLDENIALMKKLEKEPNVTRMIFSPVIPHAGSFYFQKCRHDTSLVTEYNAATKTSIADYDDLDYDLLSELFIKYNTSLTCKSLISRLNEKEMQYFDG